MWKMKLHFHRNKQVITMVFPFVHKNSLITESEFHTPERVEVVAGTYAKTEDRMKPSKNGGFVETSTHISRDTVPPLKRHILRFRLCLQSTETQNTDYKKEEKLFHYLLLFSFTNGIIPFSLVN